MKIKAVTEKKHKKKPKRKNRRTAQKPQLKKPNRLPLLAKTQRKRPTLRSPMIKYSISQR